MNKRVAVIGGRPAPIYGAKELGIDVVLVHEKGAYDKEISDHCERIIHADIADGDAIISSLEELHRQRPFDRIITTTEVGGESTGKAVDYFGLPGVSWRTANLLKDKLAMRDLLLAHELSPVAYKRVLCKEDAVEFVKNNGLSVLKPAEGVASLHIHPCNDEESTLSAFRSLEEAGVQNIIIEEYLEGPVVSVDSFSFNGKHLPIGYSQYRMNDKYVEWEVSTPSSDAKPWLDELKALTCRLLDAIELQEGPSHSEFVLTAQGPRILESHARLAGSGAPELVKRAFGLDLNRMFLTVPLGIDKLPEFSPEPIAGAAIQFFVPKPGKIVKVENVLPPDVVVRFTKAGVEPLVFLPFLFELGEAMSAVVIQKHEGDHIPHLNTVADCVSGYVLTTGKSREEAVSIANDLVKAVNFIVEP
ncbi:ATP-grasp domain-containing protein [Halomonas sp. ISL-60]|uniref:ATP-grasp domain-containing protein n=1 Tax=Halomonas sp. ISL-56 TaxID=2819149 RepID=UPI001BE83CC8|nr:ATP-grasp domain-containing protein [Halomonas sp. ISL-56]MBT2772733.1 ATP-grasp domain-containing protein [Halomonas sp. ISL-60]MBT2800528.1 ATP-grasp domain-containing protein [Halomonas sp. ISL-56]